MSLTAIPLSLLLLLLALVCDPSSATAPTDVGDARAPDGQLPSWATVATPHDEQGLLLKIYSKDLKSTFIYPNPKDTKVYCDEKRRVCISNYYAARNVAALRDANVKYIVSAVGPPEQRVEGIEYLVMYFEDVPNASLFPHARAARDFIRAGLDRDPEAKVLVHCTAGMSRSASILAFYLMEEETLGAREAVAEVKKIRPCIRPNDGFMLELLSVQPVGIRITDAAAELVRDIDEVQV